MTEILAIDDDREILAVIKKALLREGYQVTALEDPLQLEEDQTGQIPAHSFRCDDAGHRRV